MADEYQDADGNPCTLDKLCRKEPTWAANRIRSAMAALARAEQAERTAADAQRRLEEVRAVVAAAEGVAAWCWDMGEPPNEDMLASIGEVETTLGALTPATRAWATGEPSAPALDPADALALARAAMTWSIAKGDGSRFIDTHDAEPSAPALDTAEVMPLVRAAIALSERDCFAEDVPGMTTLDTAVDALSPAWREAAAKGGGR